MFELIEKQVKSLLEEQPQTYSHTRGVLRLMADIVRVTGIHGQARADLFSIALLHNIGKAQAVARTGLYPYDGANFARKSGYNENVGRAVMLHSCAPTHCNLEYPGLKAEYDSAINRMRKIDYKYLELITFCDMRIDDWGKLVSINERVREMLMDEGLEDAERETIYRNREYLQALDRKITRFLLDEYKFSLSLPSGA